MFAAPPPAGSLRPRTLLLQPLGDISAALQPAGRPTAVLPGARLSITPRHGATRFVARRAFFGSKLLPHHRPCRPHATVVRPRLAREELSRLTSPKPFRVAAEQSDGEADYDEAEDDEFEDAEGADGLEDEVLHVPLNLYRIFGLDRNADSDALDAALTQLISKKLPRGFTAEAASQRKQLIDQAYHVLSEPSKRDSYEQSIDGAEASVQVPLSHIKGALCLLLECGQCEDAIQIAREKLSRDEHSTGQGNAVFDDPLPDPDAILAIALAYRDIGFSKREENMFDAASESIQEGIEVLRHFHSQRSDPMQPQFRQFESEMLNELAELRPNRILELVSIDLRDSNAPLRKKGLRELASWLAERGGLDDAGDANDETFFEFINVIRPYLLAEEQQLLFSPQERKFSPRSMMIIAQFHIARGFTNRDPREIAEAQRLLYGIDSEIQPIPVELALTSLLVGQAEVALSFLDAIRQRDPGCYHFIRKHSEGAPDMITGLMRALERWLAREVLAKFRDFLDFRVSAQSYFTDPQIVEELSRMRAGVARSASAASPPMRSSINNQRFDFDRDTAQYGMHSIAAPKSKKKTSSRSSGALESRAKGILSAFPNVVTSTKQSTGRLVLVGLAAAAVSGVLLGGVRGLLGKKDDIDEIQVENVEDESNDGAEQGDQAGQPQQIQVDQSGNPAKPGDQSATANQASTSNEPLTPAQMACRSAIQQWQTTKAQAMGSSYATDRLEDVLAEPALSQWRSRAAGAKAGKWHWNYRLENLAVDKINIDPSNPNKGTVDVTLKEDAQFMAGGVVKKEQSYSKAYRARYTLVNVGGKWKISEMSVIP